jgi:hypothetical protein
MANSGQLYTIVKMHLNYCKTFIKVNKINKTKEKHTNHKKENVIND